MPSLGEFRVSRPGRELITPLGIFIGGAAVSAAFLAVGASQQVALLESVPAYDVSSPTPASPGFFGVMSNWDGQWFRSIAENGYPTTLPTDQDGNVVRNVWAFWPLFPMLVRAVMMATTLGFGPSAWIVSLTCAATAMVVLYRLVLPSLGDFSAAALIACLCAFPTAAVLQVGYAESLTLLFIVLALAALRSRRYVLLLLAALGLSLTRPIVLPLALVIGIHGLWRYRLARLGAEAFPVRERWAVAGVAVATAASLGLWPLTADLVTGQRGAYLTTLGAWGANQGSGAVLGGWVREIVGFTPLGIVALLALCVLSLLVLRKGARAWGMDLRVWALAYPLYLLAATPVSPSLLRYSMLAIAPLWPIPDPPARGEAAHDRWARWVVLVVLLSLGLAIQYLWVTRVFTVRVSPAVQPFP